MVSIITKTLSLNFVFLFMTLGFNPCNAADCSIVNPAYLLMGSTITLSPSDQVHVAAYRKRTARAAQDNQDIVIMRGNTDEKVVSLTFDDGPDEEITRQILDILKLCGAKATFFVLGDRINNDPEAPLAKRERNERHRAVIKRMQDEGHAILSHGFAHPRFSDKETKLPATEEIIAEDILKGEEVLNQIIGEHATLIRPSFGDINENVIRVLRALNLKAVLGSIDSLDWATQTPADIIFANVVDNIHPGAIVMMHSTHSKQTTAESLREIIQELREREYTFITIPEMLELSVANDVTL